MVLEKGPKEEEARRTGGIKSMNAIPSRSLFSGFYFAEELGDLPVVPLLRHIVPPGAVALERVLPRRAEVASRAAERPLARVHALVAADVARRAELKLADGAGVSPAH